MIEASCVSSGLKRATARRFGRFNDDTTSGRLFFAPHPTAATLAWRSTCAACAAGVSGENLMHLKKLIDRPVNQF
jgi:hypothetical protein